MTAWQQCLGRIIGYDDKFPVRGHSIKQLFSVPTARNYKINRQQAVAAHRVDVLIDPSTLKLQAKCPLCGCCGTVHVVRDVTIKPVGGAARLQQAHHMANAYTIQGGGLPDGRTFLGHLTAGRYIFHLPRTLSALRRTCVKCATARHDHATSSVLQT